MKTFLNASRLFVLLSIFLLFSCKVIQPTAPPETFSSGAFKPEISEVNIPVKISIPGMEKSINHKMQGLLYEDNDLNDNGGDNLMLKISKKSDITLSVEGNEISYRLPLDIWLKTGFNINALGLNLSNYKEGNCAIALRFKSLISVDSLWNVTIKTTADGYDWISKPVIKLGNLDFPITAVANQILHSQLPKIASAIDDHSKESLHIKNYVEQTWTKLQEPILVSDTPQFWLAIHPVGVHILPFLGKSGTINSSIGIHAYVQSQLGEKPVIKSTPLPNLQILKDMNSDVNISLVSDISYQAATSLAAAQMLNHTFTFNDGKYHVLITGLNIYPSRNKLVTMITMEGSVKGTVYLEGIPYFDEKSMSLKMKETDFHVDTKNALIKSASWLLHGQFIKRIEPMLTYTLEDQLNRGRTLLQESLKEKKITEYILLDGKIEKLMPYKIILTDDGIKTVVVAKGNLQVKIDGFD